MWRASSKSWEGSGVALPALALQYHGGIHATGIGSVPKKRERGEERLFQAGWLVVRGSGERHHAMLPMVGKYTWYTTGGYRRSKSNNATTNLLHGF